MSEELAIYLLEHWFENDCYDDVIYRTFNKQDHIKRLTDPFIVYELFITQNIKNIYVKWANPTRDVHYKLHYKYIVQLLKEKHGL